MQKQYLEMRAIRSATPGSRFTEFALLFTDENDKMLTPRSTPDVSVNVEVAALPEHSVRVSDVAVWAVDAPELDSDACS